MSKAKELEELLQNEVLPEINDYIDDLFEVIASKKDTPEIKEELQNIQEMKTDFLAMLNDAQTGELEEDEYEEIINDIHDMLSEDDENDDDEKIFH